MPDIVRQSITAGVTGVHTTSDTLNFTLCSLFASEVNAEARCYVQTTSTCIALQLDSSTHECGHAVYLCLM